MFDFFFFFLSSIAHSQKQTKYTHRDTTLLASQIEAVVLETVFQLLFKYIRKSIPTELIICLANQLVAMPSQLTNHETTIASSVAITCAYCCCFFFCSQFLLKRYICYYIIFLIFHLTTHLFVLKFSASPHPVFLFSLFFTFLPLFFNFLYNFFSSFLFPKFNLLLCTFFFNLLLSLIFFLSVFVHFILTFLDNQKPFLPHTHTRKKKNIFHTV